jgi:hypothetical protein
LNPLGFIDGRGHGGRGGFVLGGSGTAIGDQSFDGDDHGEGLDLSADAAAGYFGAQVGDFPEAVEDLVAARTEAGQSLSDGVGDVVLRHK